MKCKFHCCENSKIVLKDGRIVEFFSILFGAIIVSKTGCEAR